MAVSFYNKMNVFIILNQITCIFNRMTYHFELSDKILVCLTNMIYR